MDSPNITIEGGGGNQLKPLISPPKSVESYLTAVGSNETAVDGTGTADGFPALDNQGDVNKNGTADDMDWAGYNGTRGGAISAE